MSKNDVPNSKVGTEPAFQIRISPATAACRFIVWSFFWSGPSGVLSRQNRTGFSKFCTIPILALGPGLPIVWHPQQDHRWWRHQPEKGRRTGAARPTRAWPKTPEAQTDPHRSGKFLRQIRPARLSGLPCQSVDKNLVSISILLLQKLRISQIRDNTITRSISAKPFP